MLELVNRMRCPECQTENVYTDNFCTECGCPFPKRKCLECQTENVYSNKLCTQCGCPFPKDLGLHGIENGIYKAIISGCQPAEDAENISITVTERSMEFESNVAKQNFWEWIFLGDDSNGIVCTSQCFYGGRLWAHAWYFLCCFAPCGLCYSVNVKDNKFTTVTKNSCLFGVYPYVTSGHMTKD